MKNPNPVKTLFAFLLALAMVCSMMPLSAYAATSDQIKEELKELKNQNAEIQSQINAIQSKYDANANEIQTLVDQKAAIDQEIGLLNNQIININAQIAAYGQLIADTQVELDDAQVQLTELSQKNKERIRSMEEEGSVSYWEVIFEANSFTDLLDRINMMEEIAAADQRRLQEMRNIAAQVSDSKDTLETGKSDLELTRASLDETQAYLEEKRTESDALLRELAEKQEEFQALLDESEAAQDDLMLSIAAKEKELSKAKYEENLAKLALQGQNPPSNSAWIKPVSGYTLTSPFGMRLHPVLGYYRMHNGVDMACPQGTPIYATRAGTVTVASYQAGGAGNYVSINHGDGFASIYMHMTNYVVSAGQSVSQGQLIGYVGSTGISTGPHLHFGISYAGTYVNPLAYI